MSIRENSLYSGLNKGLCVADHPTPKIDEQGVAFTLESRDYKAPQIVCVLNDQGGQQMSVSEDVTETLRAEQHGHQPVVLENHPADSRVKICKDGIVQTLSGRMGTGGGNTPMIISNEYGGRRMNIDNMIVRRLTPLECERLQGFPDHWTETGDWIDQKGKKRKGDSDGPRYKALGNSIALPFWEWMAKRMREYIETDSPTMASLFDGIGGFPLSFQKAGIKPVWGSEIEDFPMEVTRQRLGG